MLMILIGFMLGLGRLGFILLGACFALVGLLLPPVARWGERTGPVSPQPTVDEVAVAD